MLLPKWFIQRRALGMAISGCLVASLLVSVAETSAAPEGGGHSSKSVEDRLAMPMPIPQVGERVAFVRSGALWVKEQGEEHQLTPAGSYVRNPSWSHDGRWIAYNLGEEEREIWVVEASSGKSHLAVPQGGNQFRWSKAANRLAYLREDKLSVVGAEEGDESSDIAGDIGNFSWLPDGSGFLASSTAKMLPEGWTPVRISRILLTTGTVDPLQEEPFYVMPKQLRDSIVVGTSGFKWSASGDWIAFVAKPTSGLSRAIHTLCVLSSDGKSFIEVDETAYDGDQWFQWSPSTEFKGNDQLAYIAGGGREATLDKRLKVTSVPAVKPTVYTPAGFVDGSFTWNGRSSIIVSRMAEGGVGGDLGGVGTIPFLVIINLYGNKQSTIARAWDKQGEAWIKGIDLGDNDNAQRNWRAVMTVFPE